MRNLPSQSLRYLPGATGLLLSVLALSAQAQNQYFDVNGSTSGYGVVNGGSYSWDDANWGVSGGGGATTAWGAGTFARFYGAANYSVTVNNDESMAGLYMNGGSGKTLTINAAGAGDLNIVTGDQGFLAASGTTTIINAPVTGVGGLAPELSGTIYLNAHNSYSGGTTWGYSGTTLVYFNNNDAFGTGPIKSAFTSAAVAPLLSYGGTVSSPLTITLANEFQVPNNVTGVGAGFNFANGAYTPVVLTGDFNLGANNALIKNNGNSTAPLTLNGSVNGSGVVTLAGNNGGAIVLNGANYNLNGTVAVGASGAANVKVVMGTQNTLGFATRLTLGGGTLDPNGLHHTIDSTVLNLADNSVITFGAGAAEVDFANSSAEAWTSGKVLDLENWDPNSDFLRFGSDNTGLTAAQLASIEVNGAAYTLGTATLDPNGYLVIVPEPSTAALGLLGVLSVWAARRKKA